MRIVRNPWLLIAVLASAAFLLVAACGDGGVQEQRDAEGDGEPSNVELAQLLAAIRDLEVRIERLESATEELLTASRREGADVSDLSALIEELRLRLDALDRFSAARSGDEEPDDEDPCAFLGILNCPEARQVPRP